MYVSGQLPSDSLHNLALSYHAVEDLEKLLLDSLYKFLRRNSPALNSD